VTYKRPARPKSAYESGQLSLSHSWMSTKDTKKLHELLRLTNRLIPSSSNPDWHRGRRAALVAELAKRGEPTR
jgi:hypothetical protein